MNRIAGAGASVPIPAPSQFILPGGRPLLLRPGVPVVMGIVNVTPDSFSDGGVNFERQRAADSALQMQADGAAIVDIGGESTRPGASAIGVDEEMARVLPVIEKVRRRSSVAISVDTRNAAVALAAIEAGADIVNDVSALRHDPGMAAVVAQAGVPVILMHMRGDPRTMDSLARYDDVVAEVASELRSSRDNAAAAGISQIFVDPGIGFAKTLEHNLEILAHCEEFARLGPVVIGASRKKFVGALTGREAGPDRVFGSLAAVAAAVRGRASVVRVHDVRPTVDFLRVLSAIGERA